MFEIFSEIINGTPIYAWAILAFLIMRGLNAAKDAEICFPKMVLVPAIFMVWGLDKLVTRFSYIGEALLFYVLFAAIGTFASYLIYSRYRRIYIKDNSFFRTGSYLPLTIMLTNFFVKYALNVALGFNSSFYNTLSFNVLYAILSGFSVGLFLGGIFQAYTACSGLKTNLSNI